MAQRTFVQLIDDLDGSEADETVSFALDGQDYVIDLTAKHAEDLRARISEFAGHARRTNKGSRRTTSPQVSRTADRAAVRDWAREQGHDVAPRGRISQAIIDAYHAAVGH